MDQDEFGPLLRSARGGDEQAYGALWRRHHARVLPAPPTEDDTHLW